MNEQEFSEYLSQTFQKDYRFFCIFLITKAKCILYLQYSFEMVLSFDDIIQIHNT